MKRDQILATVTLIMQDLLDDENIQLADATTASDVELWDSVVHVKLMIAIESRYNIRFDTDELTSSETIGELIDMIESKCNIALK